MATAEQIEQIRRTAGAERGLGIISVARADGSVQSTLVNAGVMNHPVTGEPTLACVVRASAIKLRLLRNHGMATLTFRTGWRYAAAEGRTSIIGPDDPAPGFDAERLRLLLREVFTAAGGTHDNWPEYDRVMAEERRTAVFMTLDRVYGNG
jgi:hypothetical protein